MERYSVTIPVGEPRRAWQHLANAGLIEGTYTGRGDEFTIPGTNAPRGRISNTAFDFVYIQQSSHWGETHSTQSNGNQLLFGVEAGGFSRGAVLKPEEAWNIDTKMDDGRPDQGALQTDTAYSAACFTGAYPNATYALNVATTACSFRFTLR